MLRKYVTTACVACSVTLTLSSSAMAADVNVSNTGANSSQSVVINDSSDVTTSNTSVVTVTNENSQQAATGDVVADGNTSVGGLVSSGDATNTNSTGTTVAVTNDPVTSLPTVGEGTSGGGAVGGTGTSNGAGTPVGRGGNVLGAATVGGLGGGVAMLPVTGPSVPVDVSALRAAWHAQTPAPIATLAKNSQLFTGAMLLMATLLSLLGGLGSAWYAKRREERV